MTGKNIPKWDYSHRDFFLKIVSPAVSKLLGERRHQYNCNKNNNAVDAYQSENKLVCSESKCKVLKAQVKILIYVKKNAFMYF